MGGPVEGKPPLPTKTPPAVQVMTKEQLDTLRKQISVYATLCSQLVELRRRSNPEEQPVHASSQEKDGSRGVAHPNGKDTGKRRWGPSHTQLHTLKKIFKEVGGTPAKQRIKEIAADLSKYGPINESNVYNWFQNRKARAKKVTKRRRYSEEETDNDLAAGQPERCALQAPSV